MRGLRRLRRGLDLPVRAAGGHRVRPQDPHPPGLLQLRPELPEGRLPVVPAGRAGPGGQARRPAGAAGRAGRPDLPAGRRRHAGPDARHRWHRGGHHLADPAAGRAPRRRVRRRAGADRAGPEGRPGGQRPAVLDQAADRGAARLPRAGRRRARLRPARRGRRPDAAGRRAGPDDRRAGHRDRADRGDGHRAGGAARLARTRRSPGSSRRPTRPRTSTWTPRPCPSGCSPTTCRPTCCWSAPPSSTAACR